MAHRSAARMMNDPDGVVLNAAAVCLSSVPETAASAVSIEAMVPEFPVWSMVNANVGVELNGAPEPRAKRAENESAASVGVECVRCRFTVGTAALLRLSFRSISPAGDVPVAVGGHRASDGQRIAGGIKTAGLQRRTGR